MQHNSPGLIQPPRYTRLRDVQHDLALGQLSVAALTRHYLDRIEATRHLNAYVEVYAAEALERAHFLDEKYRRDPAGVGKLFGMVVSIKDVLCYEGHRVSAASRILDGFVSPYSATAIERLLAEDALIIGRVNCDQFAMGSSNENSVYGPVGNAFDPDTVPGGSSGGSAVSVQADTCLASLGSDTGGSVRQPAAFCGIVGFKPTYGRISRHGLLAYGSSFDQIGTLTHSVDDAALLLEVMAGADDFDGTASQRPVPAYSANGPSGRTMRIACIESVLHHEGMDPGIRQCTLDFLQRLRNEGHEVGMVDFAYLDYLIPAYYVLTTAEASSNLSRYDGIRFGYRSPDAHDLYETQVRSRTEGFSEEVRRRILLGAFVLSSGYYDAYYTKAQQVRRLIRDRLLKILEQYDFIFLPASPVLPWKIGEKAGDPVSMYLADVFTVPANMAGLPAICIPGGHLPGGWPVGMQFMARPFEEADLMAFASNILKYI